MGLEILGSAGAPPPDGAWAQFPSFAKANGIDVDKIKVEPVAFQPVNPCWLRAKLTLLQVFLFFVSESVVRVRRAISRQY